MKRGPGSAAFEKILCSVQQTQKSFSMIVAEARRERPAAFAEDGRALCGGEYGELIHRWTRPYVTP